MPKQSIDTFIDQLLNKRGYADALKEVKEELHKDLLSRLDEFIVTRTISEFSKEEVEQFEKLLDESTSTEELKQFAVDHIADYTTVMTNALLIFQDAYLS